jgi:ATP adenylyltransferase
MEIKFTPWRMHYIKRVNEPKQGDCVLCGLHEATPEHDRENLVLYRSTHCYVVLNLYPYNTAHMMVVPYQHTADFIGLAEPIAAELFTLTRRCVGVIGAEYEPHGFNVGLNLGRVAGAGIEEHLHMHIVPRWGGDSNFMPIIAGTKLIPETLDVTYGRLLPHFS